MKMKLLLIIITIGLLSCSSDDEKASDILISVTNSQNWDGENITVSDLGTTEFIDENGEILDYDIKAQTHAVIDNISRILEEAGSSLDQVIDVTTFLVDMKRDFQGYNEVWAETLGQIGPTRTTLAIRALPTPIAVEMKVIAQLSE